MYTSMIDELTQRNRNSNASAMEVRLICTNPSIREIYHRCLIADTYVKYKLRQSMETLNYEIL